MSQILKKIGVFGGAFDPPHKAHQTLAQAALVQLELDVLYVVPTGQAWHKARVPSAAAHRLAMTRLAFEDMPQVIVDNREIMRTGPTFTIDTLKELQVENTNAQLYLLMGGDQLAAFRQWHEWRAIAKIAMICVADRAQVDGAKELSDVNNELSGRILMLSMLPTAISATSIRQQLAARLGENQVSADLLCPTVESYIAQHRLYKSP